eukprot:scaffold259041_cov17-Prasinocladus_malaysianus.AAC.2
MAHVSSPGSGTTREAWLPISAEGDFLEKKTAKTGCINICNVVVRGAHDNCGRAETLDMPEFCAFAACEV